MFICYVISLCLTWIFSLIFYLRIFINRKNIKFGKPKERYYTFVRYFLICIIPVVNIITIIVLFYMIVILDTDKFVEKMSS